MRFVLPHSPEQRPAWLIRLGLFLYDHIGGRKKLPATRVLDLTKAPEGAPIRKAFRKAFEYSDCWVDDARLVVVNALDAKERGAEVRVGVAMTSARRDGSLWRASLVNANGAAFEAQARALVNAAGPWVGDVLRAAGGNADKKVRLIKGSHIVLRKFWRGEHAYFLQNADKRLVFVIPYEGDLAVIGTTDIPYDDRPEEVAIHSDEVDYLLAIVNQYFVAPLSRDDVLWSYSGVRPLFDDHSDDPSAVTRDYVFDLDAPDGLAPMLSIFGGKITTYRKLAEHALEKLKPFFPTMRGSWTEKAALPGGDMPGADFSGWFAEYRARLPWLPEALALALARRHGTRATKVLGDARSLADLGRDFGGGLTEREARYLCAEEWARRADDILYRRTKCALHMSDAKRTAFADWLATGR
jgi:glycerol-3-phosphate dehydrogenase